jgi:hypothetical protein
MKAGSSTFWGMMAFIVVCTGAGIWLVTLAY